jgi:hypothetical protein
MNETEIQEVQDTLYNTALALEEMIVFQEGRLPTRVAEIQRRNGYAEARKSVLNECRASLRKTKTFMLRTGVIRSKAPQESSQERLAVGLHDQNVELARDRTGQVAAPQIESQAPRKRKRTIYLNCFFITALAIAGFWNPNIHTGMVVGGTLAFISLVVYWEIVGVRFE